DFNRFGRTYQVIAQADAAHRARVETVAALRTRNQRGDMVPIGSVASVRRTAGADPVMRYNAYLAADLIGEADRRVLSSNQAMSTVASLARKVLPNGFEFEWTDLSYQQATEGNRNAIAFPISVLLAFLVLAALYESFVLPLAVILIVPM